MTRDPQNDYEKNNLFESITGFSSFQIFEQTELMHVHVFAGFPSKAATQFCEQFC